MASLSFVLLGGRPAVTPTTQSNGAAMALITTRPAGGATHYQFSRSNGGTNGDGGTCLLYTSPSPRD